MQAGVVEGKARNRLLIFAAIALALLIVAGALAWTFRAEWLPLAQGFGGELLAFLQSLGGHPVAFFTAMALIPLLPVPISPFYLTTGVFPPEVAIPGILISIAVNFAISYWLARTFMRPLADRLFKRAGVALPQLPDRRSRILFAVFLRICGTPYTLQNYIIPLSGLGFRDYMLYGLPFQYAPALAMMFLGDALIKGQARGALIAIGVLAALGIGTKLARDLMARRRQNDGD